MTAGSSDVGHAPGREAQEAVTAERAHGNEAGGRRVLMIAHDFPPASTSGALRAFKFVRHLDEYGWAASVVTVRTGAYGATDPALLRDLPAHCRVHRAFGFDTKAVLSIRNRYLRLLATPDRTASWFPHGVISCLRVTKTEQPKVLLSTSPPVTAHCIGLAVKRLTKLPWIVELRDGWNLDVPSGSLSRRLDHILERGVLTTAERIVVTSEGLAAELEERLGKDVGRRIAVVANGYDEQAFARLKPPPAGLPFRIAHIGQCLPPERDPVPFLHAVRRCLDRGELPTDTEVIFVGAGASFDRELSAELRRLRLASNVRSTPRLSHAEALQIMLATPVLLLLQTRHENRHAIPAKAYEYLRTPAYILSVAPPASATATLLSGFPGVLQASAEVEPIAQCLAQAYRHWRDTPGAIRFERNIERYSGTRLAGELAQLLDELGGGPATNHPGFA